MFETITLATIINIGIPILVAIFVVMVIVKNVKKAKKGEGCSMCNGGCSSGSCGTKPKNK